MFSRILIAFAAAGLFIGACTDTESNTNLNPDGPPEIAQVRLLEAYTDSSNTALTRRVFAYGSHPMATSDDEHPVTTAAATMQSMRIIMDELLVGNYLEQVQCRAPVDANGAFSNVPLGATPDDIAKCCVAGDALLQTCIGPLATCVCQLPGGCGDVMMGQPVGILDVNEDGAADNTSFMPNSVGLQCSGITVPIDPDNSYYNPSGNQQVPAMGGFDALGPAIVLAPLNGVLPTNTTCQLTFNPNIVDKDGNKVCAPPNGRPADCTGRLDQCEAEFEAGCTPGDVSNFSFKVLPFSIALQGVSDGDTGVDGTSPFFANANAPVSVTSLANITITPAPPGGFTVTAPMPTQIKITFTTPLTTMTMYTLTIPVTVTDSFMQGLPAPLVIHFTTA